MKNGLFVASENLTVMVSPSPNTASSIGKGSTALIEVMNGPGLSPKLPINNKAVSLESNDVPSLFLSPPPANTLMTRSPTVGEVLPVASIIVMIRIDGFTQVPT